MNEFGYLSVLLSIILGLAVTQVLGGARGCLLARSRVREYWPTHVWAAWLLVLITQLWWSMYGLRERRDWTFGQFAVLLAETVALFLVTGLVYPDFLPDREIDLHAHYFSQRRHFYGLLLVLVLTSIGRSLVLHHRLPLPEDLFFHLGFMAMSLGGLFIANERYHKISTLFTGGLLGGYVVLLFTQLE